MLLDYDVRRLGVQIVSELLVLEVREQVLANVLERTVERVGAPAGVRRRHDRRRLCTPPSTATY